MFGNRVFFFSLKENRCFTIRQISRYHEASNDVILVLSYHHEMLFKDYPKRIFAVIKLFDTSLMLFRRDAWLFSFVNQSTRYSKYVTFMARCSSIKKPSDMAICTDHLLFSIVEEISTIN